MSSETNAYYLKREYFGQNLNFRKREDTDLKSLCFRPDSLAQKNYEYRNPKILSVTNIVEKSSHIVNTEKTTTKSVPIKHIEGGWPEYVVNNSEVEKMQREMKNWVRAKEKTEFFEDKVKKLIANSTRILKQNLRMDIYEDYFEENPNSKMEDNFSAKIKMVFKDTEPYRRIVSKVAWMIPEDKEEQTKVAVAYKLHKDQEIPPNYKLPCLVWSMDNPNTPLNVLSCNSEILTLAFNTRISHILGAGCANGTAVIFDLHTNKIIASTRLEDSHSEPISDFVWLKSKNGNEFVTSSTDGRVIWWEIRDMLSTTNPPTIVPDKPLYLVHKDAEAEKEYGGTKIEYNPDVGSTKFLIGTEQGIIFIANKKKQEAEANMKLGIIAGRHLGPIVGMQRCPHHPKFILSVGDWTARVMRLK